MTHGLLLDPRTGIAGDMLIGALSWIFQEKNGECALNQIVAEFNNSANEWGFRIQFNGMNGGYLVDTVSDEEQMPFETLKSILHQLGAKLRIGDSYLSLAYKSIENLFSAERHSHATMYGGDHGKTWANKDKTKYHLHEAHDAIIDVLFTAVLLEKLDVNLQRVFVVKPIPLGRGTITFSHGTLKVPVPAVRHLMRNAADDIFEQGHICEELTTPTGLAILLALSPIPLGREQYDNIGTKVFKGKGYGHKKLPIENSLIAYLVKI